MHGFEATSQSQNGLIQLASVFLSHEFPIEIMKKTIFFTAAAMLVVSVASSSRASESVLTPINNQICGTIFGHVRYLGMYRDYETRGYGQSSSVGFLLGYTSDRWAGFDFGLAYNYSFSPIEGGDTGLLANDDVNVLNEGWLRYSFGEVGFEKTSFLVGRKINNGSIFRNDDFRQKERSIESVQITSTDIENLTVTMGHAVKMSNWIGLGDRWDFNDFGDVFGVGYETDGITWGEMAYTGVHGWKITVFDAYAWDVSNLIGSKIEYNVCDDVSLIAYYRHEGDVGRADVRNSDAYGVSYRQKLGGVTLEPGYFSVHGSGLRFQELTTGIDHPLGSTMILCSGSI